MMTEEEEDNKIEEEIQALVLDYKKAVDAFHTAKTLVERWSQRDPGFKEMARIDEKYRFIKIRDVGREDGEETGDEKDDEGFSVWITETGDIEYCVPSDQENVDSAEKWLDRVRSAIANRIAWLRAVKGENKAI
jgi:hypothetical protein